jgi:hypothetical protein
VHKHIETRLNFGDFSDALGVVSRLPVLPTQKQSHPERNLTMRGTRRGFKMISVVAVLAAACHSAPNSASPAAAGASAAETAVSSAPLSSQLTTATITDPSLNNMTAATLTIPAGWKMQGIMLLSPCNTPPFPAYRAYSPDGLTQMRAEPVFGWHWAPNVRNLPNAGCAPLSGVMTAAQFLDYYISTLKGGVHVVGPMTVPPKYQQWASGLAAQFNQISSGQVQSLQANHTADTAALRVQVINGSFVVEERLRAAVECGVNNNPGVMNGGNCWARLDVLTAPQGKLDALVQLVDSNNLPHGVVDPQWGQAFLARQQRQGDAMLAQLAAQAKAESNMIYQQFQQNMARSQAEHQAFMQQQESQFQSAMSNANASMNAQTTAASDWVDYALDQQTVVGAGGTAKVSSAYSQTWSNGQGQWYQTNNPNSNPNGVFSGNWTQDTKVHGNGQSY